MKLLTRCIYGRSILHTPSILGVLRGVGYCEYAQYRTPKYLNYGEYPHQQTPKYCESVSIRSIEPRNTASSRSIRGPKYCECAKYVCSIFSRKYCTLLARTGRICGILSKNNPACLCFEKRSTILRLVCKIFPEFHTCCTLEIMKWCGKVYRRSQNSSKKSPWRRCHGHRPMAQ